MSNWTNLLPAVSQDALGMYCEKGIVIPSAWAGSKGVISVVQDAADGLLYQVRLCSFPKTRGHTNKHKKCAAVNFVSGSATTVPSACTNVTGLTATFTQAAALSSIPASATASSTESAKSAAGRLSPVEYSAFGAAAWVVMLGVATAGVALM